MKNVIMKMEMEKLNTENNPNERRTCEVKREYI